MWASRGNFSPIKSAQIKEALEILFLSFSGHTQFSSLGVYSQSAARQQLQKSNQQNENATKAWAELICDALCIHSLIHLNITHTHTGGTCCPLYVILAGND